VITKSEYKELKTGDTIKLILGEGYEFHTSGQLYTITNISSNGVLTNAHFGNRIPAICIMKDFELVKQSQHRTTTQTIINTDEPPCCGNYDNHSRDCEYIKYQRANKWWHN